MKERQIVFALLILVVIVGGSLAHGTSEEKPSPELLALGRELFNAKERLGTKYACILCHQKEKAIQRTEIAELGDQLPDAINMYLVEKAKGKPLAKESEEMKALEAYIRHEHSV